MSKRMLTDSFGKEVTFATDNIIMVTLHKQEVYRQDQDPVWCVEVTILGGTWLDLYYRTKEEAQASYSTLHPYVT